MELTDKNFSTLESQTISLIEYIDVCMCILLASSTWLRKYLSIQARDMLLSLVFGKYFRLFLNTAASLIIRWWFLKFQSLMNRKFKKSLIRTIRNSKNFLQMKKYWSRILLYYKKTTRSLSVIVQMKDH